VFAVQDGRARIRDVEVGAQNGSRAQITGGLSQGDGVVVYPSDRVADGVRVQAR
jgi:HlyD family secretion protein